MENQTIEDAILAIDISPVEFILITLISLLGGMIHEYVVSKGKKHKNQNIYMNLLMSTVISAILCIVLNPYVIQLSPRLILLPPLIIGMVGPELVIYMVGLRSSSKVIEYVLSLMGIIKKDNVEIPKLSDVNGDETVDDDDDAELSEEEQLLHELDVSSEYLLNKVRTVLHNYIHHEDQEEFKKHYSRIRDDIINVKNISSKDESLHIPLETALRIAEILKIYRNLENIYRDITSDNTSTSN